MSIDKSLVTKGKLARHRNVLSRAERIKFLTNENLWEDGRSVFGLPKVKNLKMKKAAKAEKEKTEVTEETAAAPTGEEKKEKAP
jgi:small basic protein (TIGR04137 family)